MSLGGSALPLRWDLWSMTFLFVFTIKGFVHQVFFFYCWNLIFWIVMGFDIAGFGRWGLITAQKISTCSTMLFLWCCNSKPHIAANQNPILLRVKTPCAASQNPMWCESKPHVLRVETQHAASQLFLISLPVRLGLLENITTSLNLINYWILFSCISILGLSWCLHFCRSIPVMAALIFNVCPLCDCHDYIIRNKTTLNLSIWSLKKKKSAADVFPWLTSIFGCQQKV